MDIKEIVNRPITEQFNQEELEFVISEYIYDKKGERLKVNVINPISPSPLDVFKAQSAFDTAVKYFKEKYDTTEKENL